MKAIIIVLCLLIFVSPAVTALPTCMVEEVVQTQEGDWVLAHDSRFEQVSGNKFKADTEDWEEFPHLRDAAISGCEGYPEICRGFTSPPNPFSCGPTPECVGSECTFTCSLGLERTTSTITNVFNLPCECSQPIFRTEPRPVYCMGGGFQLWRHQERSFHAPECDEVKVNIIDELLPNLACQSCPAPDEIGDRQFIGCVADKQVFVVDVVGFLPPQDIIGTLEFTEEDCVRTQQVKYIFSDLECSGDTGVDPGLEDAVDVFRFVPWFFAFLFIDIIGITLLHKRFRKRIIRQG